jgi:citrate lyase subunit beta-like protein
VSTNFRNTEVLRGECRQGSEFGFTGKQAIHPTQIPIIHEAFSPSKEAVEHAERLLGKFLEEEAGQGRGAWEFEGKMVDRPVIGKAMRVLKLAINFNIVPDEARSSELLKKSESLDKMLNASNSEEDEIELPEM